MTKRNHVKQWIEALRSGKYEQGRGYLLRGGKYCCLGVACEILNVTKIDKGSFFSFQNVGEESNSAYMGPVTQAIYGLTDSDQSALTAKNDSGSSFTEIADYIEALILPTLPEDDGDPA